MLKSVLESIYGSSLEEDEEDNVSEEEEDTATEEEEVLVDGVDELEEFSSNNRHMLHKI